MTAVAQSADRQRVVRLLALWSEYWRAAGPSTAEDSRIARLHYIAAVIGRPVASANDLAPPEIATVIRSLKNDLAAPHDARSNDVATSALPSQSKSVLTFPNRSGISKRMLWKIRQVEHYLGWHAMPLRLERLLEEKFKTSRPEHLTHAQAWRAVEMLLAIAARSALKADRGPNYKVGKKELDAARDRIKRSLESWRPPELREY